MNPESFKLFFLGDCTSENELYQKAYQYVRNTQMMEVSEIQKSNSFSAEENRKHFILFHSWESYPENTKVADFLLPKTCPFVQPLTWAKKPCLIYWTINFIFRKKILQTNRTNCWQRISSIESNSNLLQPQWCKHIWCWDWGKKKYHKMVGCLYKRMFY